MLFKKQLVSLHTVTKLYENFNNLEFFLKNHPNIRENWTASFWMRVHNLTTQQEFIDLVGLDNLEKFETINKLWIKKLENYTHTFNFSLDFLSSPKKDTFKLFKYFDEYGDQKASMRIVNYLEKNLNV